MQAHSCKVGGDRVYQSEQLLTLKHDTELKVSFEVLPSPTSNLALVIFSTLNLKLKAPLITLEDFETGKLGDKPVGTVMDFPSITVTVLTEGADIQNIDNYFEPITTGKSVHPAADATLRFTLIYPVKSIRFGIGNYFACRSTYKCYYENLNLVKAGSTPIYDVAPFLWVDITETSNREIKFIDITDGGDSSDLDNFSMIY